MAAEVSGRVIAFSVEVGTAVVEGDELALLESMKMEIPVVTSVSGVVESILARPDDIVEEGQVLFTIKSRSATS